MRNRKQRRNQRTDKYQEQQRVPECLSKDNDDAPIYGEDDEYSREDYDYSCGDSECGICASRRYAELDKDTVPLDWMSVDSAEDEHETNNYLLSLAEAEHAQRNKEPTSLDKVEDKQEPPVCLNRYALLDEEAETSSDEQGPQTCSNPEEEEEDNLDGKTVEDESDWNVVRYRSSKDVNSVLKQMKIHKCRIAEALAYNKSTLFYNPAKIKKWIDSWCNAKRVRAIGSGDETLIISTDGLFRENRKAGYGVIVRSRSGVPLVGSARVYTRGKPVSAFYHVLQGINRGLELAIKYGLGNGVKVYCNSCLAAHLFQSRSGCFCGYEYNNFRLGIVCKTCTQRYTSESSEEDFQTLIYPLIEEIMEKFAMYSFKVYAIKRRRNRAADYLAKLQVKKEEMEPHEFPEELKAILYEDAKGGHVMAPFVWRERAWW